MYSLNVYTLIIHDECLKKKIPETDWTLLCQRSVFPGCPVRFQSGRDGNRNLAEQTAQGNNRITQLLLQTLVVYPSSQTHTASFQIGSLLSIASCFVRKNSIVKHTIRSRRVNKTRRQEQEQEGKEDTFLVLWVEIAQRYTGSGWKLNDCFLN